MSIDLSRAVRLPASLRPDVQVLGPRVDPAALDDVLRALALLPKVELHLHIEGSLRPETVCEMAARHEPLSPFCREDWHRDHWTFRDLAGFVDEFRQVLRICLREPDDYYRLARECFEDLAEQGVVYAEPSFGPRLEGRPRYVPQADILDAFDQARRDVESRTDLRIGIVNGLNRLHSVDGALMPTLAQSWVEGAVAARERGVPVVGIDLHGDEQNAPDVGPFVAAYRTAAEAGLGLRAHAGEGSGAATVWDSIRRLSVHRIGHGVRSTEDPGLIEHLAASGVTLDVCPTSNVLTAAVPSLAEHPLRALDDAGVPLTISSDDPLVFETSITGELALLQLRMGYSLADLGRFTVQAAAASFLPETDRAELIRTVREAWP